MKLLLVARILSLGATFLVGSTAVVAQTTLDDRGYFPPPVAVVPQELPRLASRLAVDSRQLAENVRRELTGLKGLGLDARAEHLTRVGEVVSSNAASFGAGDILMLGSLVQYERALGDIRNAFRGLGGPLPPRTNDSMERIERLVFRIRSVIGHYGAPPEGIEASLRGRAIRVADLPGDVGTLIDLLSRLTRSSERFFRLAWAESPALVDAAVAFRDQAAYLSQLPRVTVRYGDLRHMAFALRTIARQINDLIAQTSPPRGVYRSWVEVVEDVNRLTAFLGGGADPVTVPVPLERRVTALRPIPDRPNVEFMDLLGRALAHADSFALGARADIDRVPEGRIFAEEGRRLREAMLEVNRRVWQGAPRRQVIAPLEDALNVAHRIAQRQLHVTRGDVNPSIVRFRELLAMLERLHQMLG